ncbi:lysine--tRNA ligase [bacterium DOLZORAL124_38_8]|nr:MAG: lysine--tRNA ligase [bacterium DOLZORAL124_38_8]
MSEENRFITERKQKINLWEEKGFAGYANKFDRTHTSQEAKKKSEDEKATLRDATIIMNDIPSEELSLCGRITNKRAMGKLAFLRINDTGGDFQICLSQKIIGDEFKSFLKMIDLGDFCGFSGELFFTKHGEPTLMAKTITPLSKALRPLPEKWAGVSDTEMCYRERNLDLVSNKETFERFKLRSKLIQEVRHFFEEKDFYEVETAILQPQAGGAMAKVFETHHNALDHNFVLRISLELDLKRAIGGGFERIFEIGKNFRNEGSDPSHLQEFTMCEWYAAYQDLETNKQWTEELFHRFCQKVFRKEIFTVVDADGNETEINFGGKFAEARFPDLLKEYANIDMFAASDEVVVAKAKEVGVEKIEGVGRANLLDDIYKKTARGKLIQPTFVFDYPEDLKPLARPNGDGTASCFQLVVNGWEIVNSYGELIDPQVQRKLLEAQAAAREAGDDEAMPIDEVFLKAMEHGFPPMTGSGFGIDRLMAIFTGQPNLRDVVLFPTMRPKQ